MTSDRRRCQSQWCVGEVGLEAQAQVSSDGVSVVHTNANRYSVQSWLCERWRVLASVG